MFSVGAGLRRGEIDHLTWDMVDVEKGVIALSNTDHRKPKTKESKHPFPVSWEVIAAIGKRGEDFVICPHKVKEQKLFPDSFYPQRHRCSPEFKKLNSWLRTQGVTEQCPLHTMRKEFGPMVNNEYGIEVAAKQLRHAMQLLLRFLGIRITIHLKG